MVKIHIKKCYPYKKYKLKHSLDLSDNQISDISSLENLINLEKLELSDNEIKDISPLQNLKNLKELNLKCDEFTDISPLANLVNLEYLGLECGYCSPKEEIEKLQKALPNCRIGVSFHYSDY